MYTKQDDFASRNPAANHHALPKYRRITLPRGYRGHRGRLRAHYRKNAISGGTDGQERRSTFKAGPDSVSFIQNALNAAQDHPDILPAGFGMAAFKNDVDLFTVIQIAAA
uniref:Uncharacterized protein n=1 Tax=Candidatus Kentrum sp. SD TaxID=2126332 RepID=A0A451BQY0_9GAMM|nr:MAG: hypothetical protein BECKSD772D_GA0070982_11414 [Candidatus Kentron sp. SD]